MKSKKERLQVYLHPTFAEWVRQRADETKSSVSFVLERMVVNSWDEDKGRRTGTPATNIDRHMVFSTCALDALLMAYADDDLRQRVIAAYHRKLVKLGIVAPSPGEAPGTCYADDD